MTKYLLVVFLLLFVLVYVFLYLGIELDLKFVVESPGANTGRLIDTASNIRNLSTIQLVLFIIVSMICLYKVVKKK